MSLIASTGGVALLPAYARTFLPRGVTTRPLRGRAPTIDLSIAYRKASDSPVLKIFLSQIRKALASAWSEGDPVSQSAQGATEDAAPDRSDQTNR
jgi:LysR family hca operon transcriptional activator